MIRSWFVFVTRAVWKASICLILWMSRFNIKLFITGYLLNFFSMIFIFFTNSGVKIVNNQAAYILLIITGVEFSLFKVASISDEECFAVVGDNLILVMMYFNITHVLTLSLIGLKV